MMGLREFPEPAEPHILVFTSHPLLFTHPTVRTIDVGCDAAYVDEDKAHHDLWEGLMRIDLVVAFAIRLEYWFG